MEKFPVLTVLGRWGLLGLLVGWPLGGWGSDSTRKLETIQHWQGLTARQLVLPRAFIRGDRIRIVFSNGTERAVFKADWDKWRVPTRYYEVNKAVLKHDTTPPPQPQSGWREATVVAAEEWRHLARAVLDELTPRQAGQGIYFQAATGDGVLYRDGRGDVRLVPLADKPEEVQVQLRFSMTETVEALAVMLESQLTNTHPGTTLFLLLPPEENHLTRPALLDLERRKCVLLSPPSLADDPGGISRLFDSARRFPALLIESHTCAILKNPFSSVARLGNFLVQHAVTLLGPRLRQRRAELPEVASGPGMDLSEWEQWLDQHTSTRRERGTLDLLINGEKFFPRFQQALAAATNSIHINVCIFDRDDVAVEIADLLRERSTEIEVKVILDQLSSSMSGALPPATPLPEGFVPPHSIASYLKKDSRVRVRPFLNPFLSSDHSKVFIVDGGRAWLGGMNLGREYRYEWHDMMVEVEGPVVASFARQFSMDWSHAGPLGDLAYAGTGLFGKPPSPGEAVPEGCIDLRRLSTKTGRPMICKAELEAFRRARDLIYIENPYLFDNRILVGLVRARLRGVDVRVVLPNFNDLEAGHKSNLVTANYLLKHRVRVYFYPGMTHIKALLVDGWACLGSANFNNLSLHLNQEHNLATSDPGFTARLKQELFATDFAKSHELTEPIAVTWTDHVADSVFNQF